jgi:SAM-dependent methyltransferase
MSIKTNPVYQALRSAKWTIVGWRKNPPWKRARISETSKCRPSLAPFCQGDGMDVGFGGDPIVPHAICMDLPARYASYKNHVQHLHGSADNLQWFRDNSLDWIYSSHVLEDFEDTRRVLDEWLRVVKPGGFVVLYLPDEPTYRKFCADHGRPPNAHHIHATFGPQHVRQLLAHRDDFEIVHQRFPVGIYSFELVIKKFR